MRPRAAIGTRHAQTAAPARRRCVTTFSFRPSNLALQKTCPVFSRAPRLSTVTLPPSTWPAAGRRGVSVRPRNVIAFAAAAVLVDGGAGAGLGWPGGLGVDGGGFGGDGVVGGGVVGGGDGGGAGEPPPVLLNV